MRLGGRRPRPNRPCLSSPLPARCALPVAGSDRARLRRAPAGGVVLETAGEIRADAPLIESLAVDSGATALGNATGITRAEREPLARSLAWR